MKKLIITLILACAAGTVFALSNPTITVINKTQNPAYATIQFGCKTWAIGSTGGICNPLININERGVFTFDHPMTAGDKLTFPQGLLINSPNKAMSVDKNSSCFISGFAAGVKQVYGRGYLMQNDALIVTVTDQPNPSLTWLYDVTCQYSK